MELGFIVNLVFIGLCTILLIAISADEARQEKRLRKEQLAGEKLAKAA